MEHLRLKHDKSKSASTPGVKVNKAELRDVTDQLLEGDRASMYRACVARGIYLSQDRSDILFATKELSRRMASPREEQ